MNSKLPRRYFKVAGRVEMLCARLFGRKHLHFEDGQWWRFAYWRGRFYVLDLRCMEDGGMNNSCTLFNYVWSGSDREFGHIVFRGPRQLVDDYGYTVNKVAVFVQEDEAADYCVYRNQKTVENGTDRLENGT